MPKASPGTFHAPLKHARHRLVMVAPPMTALPDVSAVAALMAEPTRAAILTNLLDGRTRAAGELAAAAGVSPQAASNHLARLLTSGLLLVETHGRQRRYRLASSAVAHALEALGALASPAPAASRVPEGLRFARTCYDHLAGVLGVGLTEALTEGRFLIKSAAGYRTTPAGEARLGRWGVPLAAVREGRRPFARACLDWSERRHHLAGALGAAVLGRLLANGWVVRLEESRAVRLTLKGRRALESEVRLRLPAQ
jgi:DNA-binding transcriptional ArsR family regulator